MSWPEAFLRFVEKNGRSTDIYESNFPVKRYFAINPRLTISMDDILKDFPDGVEICREFDIFYSLKGNVHGDVFTASKLYRDGKILPMDLASGLAVKYLDPVPGEQILDLCCAPGTKMTLASLISKCEASFTGVDISKQRLGTARSLVKKYKLGLIRLICADGRSFDRRPFLLHMNGNEMDAVLTLHEL